MPLLLSHASSQKIFPNLLQAVVDCLMAIFEQRKIAEWVVEQKLKSNRKWGARDRAFIAKTTYDIVRWYRTLCEVAGFVPVSETQWRQFVGVFCAINNYTVAPHDAFVLTEVDTMQARFAQLDKHNIAVMESLPDWLDELGQAQLQDQWPLIAAALNQPAHMVLRANTLKTNVPALSQLLVEAGCDVETLAFADTALQISHRKNIWSTDAFKQGLFELQDAASQQVAPFLDVSPGMRVIDACAGAGGKTLHIAALMKNQGNITALDIHPRKLDELNKRAQRAGVTIIDAHVVTDDLVARYQQSADRVLLDVPCSGLGVLRRHPDSKWKLTPEFLERIMQTQAQLLERYSAFCKVGAKLLYVTCSILPCENQEQVNAFLTTHQHFRLIKDKTLSPHIEGYDGFYMALMERISE